MPAPTRKPSLATFFLFSWLHMLVQTWAYVRSAAPHLGLDTTTVFHLLTWAFYSFIYLTPALLMTQLSKRWVPRILAPLSIVTTACTLLFVQADRTIYDLYNFHFNGFVANLLFTPGGLESLGSGQDSFIGVLAMAGTTVALQIVLYWLSVRAPLYLRIETPVSGRAVFYVALTVALIQNFFYGVSDIRNDGAILESAKVYPLYQRVTFRQLAQNLGIEARHTPHTHAAVGTGNLRYPNASIDYTPVDNPPNIVMLVSESLRWDQLAPDIMPATWEFAQKSHYFKQHYSSGNGTREGLFGMFYGLYGSYWSTFLYAQKSPLLMDRIQALNYQIDLRTSARFTYPEFDKTLFAKIPKQFQTEGESSLDAWENDVAQTDGLLNFLQRRDTSRPFMTFLFYNATHARYSFPEAAVVKRPYLEKLNYAGLSKESLAPHIGELKNRYANAARSIDMQMSRVLSYLQLTGLLDNTIVIITGDHGEEFMEKGFWGHNSSFVEQQTHTPMVVWMPGAGHAEIDRLTSHLDISTTLLQKLGAPADSATYSLGQNLFDDTPRPYIVISDWHSIAVRTADMNYRIPYINKSVENWAPSASDDKPYSAIDGPRVLEKNRGSILSAIQNSSRFYAEKHSRTASKSKSPGNKGKALDTAQR